MQLSRSLRLYRKSEAALIAAIEIYNKPQFTYRDESFAVLALNAWELLLKAKLLQENSNDPRCLYVYEQRQTSKGSLSKKKYLRRNRSGNVHTIGLAQVVAELGKKNSTRLHPTVTANLEALTEVRDNAVHFMNASPALSKTVLEIGTAAVKNYIELGKRWFQQDLSAYNLYLMPIGFVSGPMATAIPTGPDEGRLVKYLSNVVATTEEDESASFHVALEVGISFARVSKDAVAAISVTTDPSAPKVQLSEEDIRKRYPWDYQELMSRLRSRYIDFKANNDYHRIRKPLMGDARYVRSRYLDPGNPKSTKKDFYNPNILQEFDKHYTKKPK